MCDILFTDYSYADPHWKKKQVGQKEVKKNVWFGKKSALEKWEVTVKSLAEEAIVVRD